MTAFIPGITTPFFGQIPFGQFPQQFGQQFGQQIGQPFGQFPINQFVNPSVPFGYNTQIPFTQGFGGVNTPWNFGGVPTTGLNSFGGIPTGFNGVNTPWNMGGVPTTGLNGFGGIPTGFNGVNTPWNMGGVPTTGFNGFGGIPTGFNGVNTPVSQFGFAPTGFNTPVPFGFGLPGVFNTTGFNTGLNAGFNPGFNTGFNAGFSTPTTGTQNAQTPASYPFLAYAFNPYFGFNTPVQGDTTQQVSTQAA